MSYWTERAEYLRQLNKCVRCGKKDAYTMNSHSMCYECTEKSREYQRKRNRTYAQEQNQYTKERYHRLKSEGKCPICGKGTPLPNRVMCEKCTIRNKHYLLNKSEKILGF